MRHVISFLDPSDKTVVKEIERSQEPVKFYHLIIPSNLTPKETARLVTNQVMDIKEIRTGHNITICFSKTQIVPAFLAANTLQRRFFETITILLKQEDSKESYLLVWVESLIPTKKMEVGGLTDYNYSCSSCSGNCPSCK